MAYEEFMKAPVAGMSTYEWAKVGSPNAQMKLVEAVAPDLYAEMQGRYMDTFQTQVDAVVYQFGVAQGAETPEAV